MEENKMFSADPDIHRFEISFKDIKAGLSPTIAFPERFSGNFLLNEEKTDKKRFDFSMDQPHYFCEFGFDDRADFASNITIQIVPDKKVEIVVMTDWLEVYWGEIVDNIIVFEADHKHCFVKILNEKTIQLNVYNWSQALYCEDNKCEYEWDRTANIYELVEGSDFLT